MIPKIWKSDGQNFLSFSAVFCPFSLEPFTTNKWKIKILKI